jgi:aminoglycoside/choline kinase family phosphotransferase
MTPRSSLINQFIIEHGWGNANQVHLAGDASNRNYLRLIHKDTHKTAILMDAPTSGGESIRPFVNITEHLRTAGFSAPEILGKNEQHGFLLLEDLGDNLFATLIRNMPELEEPLYCAATDVLINLHKMLPPDNLMNYSPKIMAQYISPIFEWYQTAVTDQPINGMKEVSKELGLILNKYCTSPSVIALRDFHAENLIWLPDRSGIQRVGLLDYQDAVLTHPSYDLVSLLEDARRDVPKEIQEKMFKRYIDATGKGEKIFRIAYNAHGAQRNLRIIGVFCRLCMVAGKPDYINLIPRVWAHLSNNLSHPDLAALKELVFKFLPEPTPEILQRLKEKCATLPTQ